MITNLQGYSIHDGPGIRTVIFFKGCPLRCRWCANPESLEARPQIGYLARPCTECGKCFAVCEKRAIVRGAQAYRLDQEKCVACGVCVSHCFYGALVRYGEELTVTEAHDKLRRDKIFYDASGGGVTASGGEPLLRPEFISELFTLLQGEKIGTAIETCGEVPWRAFEQVLPVTDHFLFDLKLMAPEAHRLQTGRTNERILENARLLASSGVSLLFRLPLVPGVNDSTENTTETAAFLASLGAGRARLQIMPYHRMGQTKYDALGLEYQMGEAAAMTEDAIMQVAEDYQRLGVETSISR